MDMRIYKCIPAHEGQNFLEKVAGKTVLLSDAQPFLQEHSQILFYLHFQTIMATTAIWIPMCQGSFECLFSKKAVSSVLSKATVKRNEKLLDRYTLAHLMRKQDKNI